MIKNKIMTQGEAMTDNKELRQQYIDRVEVLDKVKKLLLIPQLNMMTARQIAEFYGVDMHTIQICYQRNKKEIDSDGTIVKKPLDFAKISKDTGCDFRQQVAINVLEFDGVQVVVSNRGVRCFSKRAVLRFGMLLRDSEVAKEVRTQLLNIVEHTKPEMLTVEIDKELKLLEDAIGAAFSSGDMMKFAEATMKLNVYKDRHIKAANEKIKELTEENNSLAEKNSAIAEDNKILSGNALKWSNRASANKVVRITANTLGLYVGQCWNIIYDELLYKYSINLPLRRSVALDSTQSLISYLRDDEWSLFYKTVAALLEANNISPSKIFDKAKVKKGD